MNEQPLTVETEIAEAYAVFANTISAGGQTVRRVVGYQGGSEEINLIWHSGSSLWVLLEPEREPNRYWCAYGIEDPNPVSMLSITCEINPPRSGINRRCAGLFIRGEDGSIYLAHSGKVGGGRAGIGKTAFLSSRPNDDMVPVRFPDGREFEYIVIGQIDDGALLSSLAEFVHSIAAFKHQASGTEADTGLRHKIALHLTPVVGFSWFTVALAPAQVSLAVGPLIWAVQRPKPNSPDDG